MTRDNAEVFDRSAEMLRYVPGYYRESKFYNAQNTAKGYEFDILRTIIDDFYYQFNPQTATWCLGLWEELLGIKSENRGIEERRTNIMANIMLLPKITPISLERLISSVTGTKVRVINNVAPYVFAIDIYTEEKPTYINYDSVVNLVEDVKPAHLAYETYFSFPVKVSILIETVAVEKWPHLAGEEGCGTLPQPSFAGVVSSGGIMVRNVADGFRVESDLSGTRPDASSVFAGGLVSVRAAPEGTVAKTAAMLPEGEPAGGHPNLNYGAEIKQVGVMSNVLAEVSKMSHTASGETDSGIVPGVRFGAKMSHMQINGAAEAEASAVLHQMSGEDSAKGSILKKGIGTSVEGKAIPLVFVMCGEEGGI